MTDKCDDGQIEDLENYIDTLEIKYNELCKAVDNLLGHDCYHFYRNRDERVCQFCSRHDEDNHKENCPWKKLQDLMNG